MKSFLFCLLTIISSETAAPASTNSGSLNAEGRYEVRSRQKETPNNKVERLILRKYYVILNIIPICSYMYDLQYSSIRVERSWILIFRTGKIMILKVFLPFSRLWSTSSAFALFFSVLLSPAQLLCGKLENNGWIFHSYGKFFHIFRFIFAGWNLTRTSGKTLSDNRWGRRKRK